MQEVISVWNIMVDRYNYPEYNTNTLKKRVQI